MKRNGGSSCYGITGLRGRKRGTVWILSVGHVCINIFEEEWGSVRGRKDDR